MSVTVVRKKRKTSEGKIEFRAPADWIATIDHLADRHALSRSAYIRLILSRQIRREEGGDQHIPQKDGRRESPPDDHDER